MLGKDDFWQNFGKKVEKSKKGANQIG